MHSTEIKHCWQLSLFISPKRSPSCCQITILMTFWYDEDKDFAVRLQPTELRALEPDIYCSTTELYPTVCKGKGYSKNIRTTSLQLLHISKDNCLLSVVQTSDCSAKHSRTIRPFHPVLLLLIDFTEGELTLCPPTPHDCLSEQLTR